MAHVPLRPVGGPREEFLDDRETDRNRAFVDGLAATLAERRARVAAGWGEEYAARVHKKGKWTAAERLEALRDPGAPVHALGSFVNWGAQFDQGGRTLEAPGAGVITALRELNHDILELELQLDAPIAYTAGQYAELRVPGVIERADPFAGHTDRNVGPAVVVEVAHHDGFTEAVSGFGSAGDSTGALSKLLCRRSDWSAVGSASDQLHEAGVGPRPDGFAGHANHERSPRVAPTEVDQERDVALDEQRQFEAMCGALR